MLKILKEPLIHFIFLGSLIFISYGLMPNDVEENPKEIVISKTLIQELVNGFEQTWHRQPNKEESNNLIAIRLKEEIYYREALALGLDEGDTAIRRRLKQKMEYILEDIADVVVATDEDLNTYLQQNSDKFIMVKKYSFYQVYIDPDKYGKDFNQEVIKRLEQLNKVDDLSNAYKLGEPMLLAHQFNQLSAEQVSRQLGKTFADSLKNVSKDKWQGPIRSSYGQHFVFITNITDGGIPKLADVRKTVEREWKNEQRLKANNKIYSDLKSRYSIVIEPFNMSDAR